MRKYITLRVKKILTVITAGLVIAAGLFLYLPSINIDNNGGFMSIGVKYVLAATWQDPTGHTANGWTDPTLAYNNNTADYASYSVPKASWSPYLQLAYSGGLSCDSVRAYCSGQNSDIDQIEVDVYYSGSWNNIYSSTLTQDSYQTYNIGSTQTVTEMRIRLYNSKANSSRNAYIHDADFWEVTSDPDISNSPSSVNYGTVAESSTFWSSGSEPSWPLVDGGAYFTVTNNSGFDVDISFKATNFTGGNGWTISSSTGSDTVVLTVYIEGDGSGDGVYLTTGDQELITALTTNIDWELKLETGTYTDGVAKQSTITLTAVAS